MFATRLKLVCTRCTLSKLFTTLLAHMFQVRLRIWFSGLRTRLTRRMNQEAKYQLGLRERELMLHASAKDRVAETPGRPTSGSVEDKSSLARAATTRELIVASLVEQAKALMAEVTQGWWHWTPHLR